MDKAKIEKWASENKSPLGKIEDKQSDIKADHSSQWIFIFNCQVYYQA